MYFKNNNFNLIAVFLILYICTSCAHNKTKPTASDFKNIHDEILIPRTLHKIEIGARSVREPLFLVPNKSLGAIPFVYQIPFGKNWAYRAPLGILWQPINYRGHKIGASFDSFLLINDANLFYKKSFQGKYIIMLDLKYSGYSSTLGLSQSVNTQTINFGFKINRNFTQYIYFGKMRYKYKLGLEEALRQIFSDIKVRDYESKSIYYGVSSQIKFAKRWSISPSVYYTKMDEPVGDKVFFATGISFVY